MEEHEYELRRARKILQMARAQRDGASGDSIQAQIDVLDAEHFLAVAERELKLAEQFATKGFSRPGIEAHRRAVEEAQQRLEELRAAAESPNAEPPDAEPENGE